MEHVEHFSESKKKVIRAKGWFLTYPRCEGTKEELLSSLELIGLISEYVIARELHEDGTPHLHAFVKFDRKIYYNPRLFDFGTMHGNYQVAKSWIAVQKYCKKGKDFISNIDTESAALKKGKQLHRLYTDNIKDLLAEGLIRPKDLKQTLEGRALYNDIMNEPEDILHLEKKRHFWWYGEANSGKTYKLKELRKLDKTNWFQIPTNNDWKGYNNQKYLYLDEFKGQLTMQSLNIICDGGSKVNTKGGSTVLRQDVIVYILSNWEIDGCYTGETAPLHCRFNMEKIERNY